jgi:hypothetical protein
MNDVSIEMPKYKCHKEVHALKISAITDPPPVPENTESDGSKILHFEEERYAPLRVSYDYVSRHRPEVGGYYVVYEDGYASWSPAKAFEDGYTRIP